MPVSAVSVSMILRGHIELQPEGRKELCRREPLLERVWPEHPNASSTPATSLFVCLVGSGGDKLIHAPPI